MTGIRTSIKIRSHTYTLDSDVWGSILSPAGVALSQYGKSANGE